MGHRRQEPPEVQRCHDGTDLDAFVQRLERPSEQFVHQLVARLQRKRCRRTGKWWAAPGQSRPIRETATGLATVGNGSRDYDGMQRGGIMKILGLSLALTVAAGAQDVLTNDAVSKMVKAGLGEGVIVSMIQTQPGKYSLSPDDLLKLKHDGASD